MASVEEIRQGILAGDQQLRNVQAADVAEQIEGLSAAHTVLGIGRLVTGLQMIDKKAETIQGRITEVSVAGGTAGLEYFEAVDGSTAQPAKDMLLHTTQLTTDAELARGHVDGFRGDLETVVGLLNSAKGILESSAARKAVAANEAIRSAVVANDAALTASDEFKALLG